MQVVICLFGIADVKIGPQNGPTKNTNARIFFIHMIPSKLLNQN